MKTKALLTIGMFLAVAAFVVSGRIHRAAVAARMELQALQQRNAAEAAAARQQAAEIQTLRHKVEAASAAADRIAVEQPDQAVSNRARGLPRTAVEFAVIDQKRAVALRQDPHLQVLYAQRTRGFVAQEFGPFFAQAKLSPKTTERFLDAAVNHALLQIDLDAAAADQHPQSGPAVSKFRKNAAAVQDQTYREILGETGYRAFEEYVRTMPVRTMVGRVAGHAVMKAVPLTSDQADAVVAAVLNASSGFQAGGRATLETVNWALVDGQLGQVLDPAQFAILFAERGDRQLTAKLRDAIARDRAARAGP